MHFLIWPYINVWHDLDRSNDTSEMTDDDSKFYIELLVVTRENQNVQYSGYAQT